MKHLLLSVFLFLPIHTWADDATDDADYEETDDVCVYLPDVDLNYSEEELEAALKAPDYAAKLAELLKTETDRGQALIDMLAEGRFEDAAKILPLVKNVNFHDNKTWLTPLLHCCGEGEYGEGDASYEAPYYGDRQRPGQTEMVRKLLAAGADPNFPRVSGSELPFIKAARSGDIESMRLLLAAGANPHLADSEGKTALERAAADGQYFAVKFLLELPGMPPEEEVYIDPIAAVKRNDAASLNGLILDGLYINGNYTDGYTDEKPLIFLAAQYCSTACMRLLAEKGVDLHILHDNLNALAAINYNSGGNFYSTVEPTDKREMQEYLLQVGLGRHIHSVQKAMQNAAKRKAFDCAEQLLSYGASFGHNKKEDAELLNHVVEDPYNMPNKKFIAALQKAGLNIHQCEEKSVFLAAKNGFDEVFFYLLEQGVPLTCPNTALTMVLGNNICGLSEDEKLKDKKRREKIVRYLVETRGADVHAKADDDYASPSALMLAAHYNVHIVTYLLEKGASPLEVDDKGEDILHYLDLYGTEPDTLRKLLEAGVNANSINGQNILCRAAFRNNYEIVQILLEYGTDPNSRDYKNDTPLHEAADNGNIAMVELLLRYGAAPMLTNDYKETPLQVAQERHPDNKKLLELLTPRQ